MPLLEKDEINQKVATHLRSLGFQRMTYEEKVPVGRHITGVADIVVFDNSNSPYVVVEIKANLPSSLGRFHSSIDQAFRYVEALKAKYLLITDSVKWFWYEVERDQESSRLHSIDTPPGACHLLERKTRLGEKLTLQRSYDSRRSSTTTTEH